MSDGTMLVRELAGWGLGHDEYRPAVYRGDPETARDFVSKRKPLGVQSALVGSEDSELGELFAEQESRADLRTEMAGLDWFLGVIDLTLLLAFQRRLVLSSEAVESPIPSGDDWKGLIDLCFGIPKPIVCDAVRSDRSIALRSSNPNMRFRITDDNATPIAIHSGSPFFEVALYRDRWFLRDGYHRAFRCLRAQVFRLPAVIVRARTVEELGAVQPWFFSEDVLFSNTPPQVSDFLDDALVLEYNRSPLIKTLRITVEETYTLQGETK